MIPERVISKFWKRIVKTSTCWIWDGGIGKNGYGMVCFVDNGVLRRIYAHRFSWIIEHGGIPPKMLLCHKCDNRLCVNPSHLFLGNVCDNNRDMFLKGRHCIPEPVYKRNAGDTIIRSKLLTLRGIKDFWLHVNKTNDCWLWTGSKTASGYGLKVHRGKQWRAHRFSWVIAYGDIPENMNVLHKCDTPLCVNPDHLWLGTYADNNADKVIKGRGANGEKNGTHTHPESVLRGEGWHRVNISSRRGEMNGNAKLTWAQVNEIRAAFADGEKPKSIALRYPVGLFAIYEIVGGRKWVIPRNK